MKLEDILRPMAKVVIPVYAVTLLGTAAVAKPNPDSIYNFVVGSMHKNEGNLEAALKGYINAVVADPDSAYLHNEVAEILIGTNRIEDAVTHLKNAIALDKDFVKPHLNMALVNVVKRDYRDAINEANFVLSKEPDSLTPLSIAGESYFKLGEFSKALPCFNRIIELGINSGSVFHSAYRVGQINFNGGDYLLAIDNFKKSFVMLNITDPHNRLVGCDILHYVTLAYFNVGEYVKAKETLTTLDTLMNKELNPDITRGLDELRRIIEEEDLLKKIEKGIQNKNKNAIPNTAIPK